MRIPTVSIVLGGAMFALGACNTATPAGQLTPTELAAVCGGAPRTQAVSTGPESGEAGQDRRCPIIHADGGFLSRRERNVDGGQGRSTAISRALSGRN